jgi:hypothetical protein
MPSAGPASRMRSRSIPLASAVLLGVVLLDLAAAQPLEESTATTELSCNFGMGKGETKRSCRVPFPAGCIVANFPGTTIPWATISKGGRTKCRFDESQTDWKTRITGTCGRCTSPQCSAQFSVRFDCSKR